jgi:hypothetical protein
MAYEGVVTAWEPVSRELSTVSSAMPAWRRTVGSYYWTVSPVIELVLVLLPVYLAAVLAMRMDQRWRTAIVCGAAYGLGASAVWELRQLFQPDTAGEPVVWTWVSIVGVFCVQSVFCVGLGMVAFVLFRLLIRGVQFRVAKQTGTLCWKCSYDRGKESIATCPECATPADSGRFRMRWLVALTRRGWLPRTACVLAAVGALAVCFAATGREPTQGAKDFERVTSGMMKWNKAQAGWFNGYSFPMTIFVPWYPARDGSGLAIAAGRSRTQNGLGPIWIQVLQQPGAKGTPTEGMLLEGTIGVYAALTPEQAEWVGRHGVPIELERALLAEAAKDGWAPQKSVVVPGGTTISSFRSVAPVDAGAFFPAEEPGLVH